MTIGTMRAFSWWKRALWMRLGALNGLVSLVILLLADKPVFAPGSETEVHLGAQVQFMHGMATIACATFMNIGAKGARLAPAFFMSGIVLFPAPIYAEAAGLFAAPEAIRHLGLASFAVGWLIMAWAAKDIDRG
ncbi:MAG: DUF423 domain-containing protein [Sphingobium sp.]|nr:DUF423 domain-containing protein [Sphingobium sp.]